MQLDQKEKGFSFSKEGPLDMRMDPTSALTSEQIINHWPEEKIGHLFKEYGEEPRWRRAAKAIVEARHKAKIKTTTQLADIIKDALKGSSKKKLHPATLIFQALRICVNDELNAIQTALTKAMGMLSPGGRIGVLSFHSLEDRIVKNIFKAASTRTTRQEKQGVPMPLMHLLTKKPLVPSLAEINFNPRSRSAKLRFAEKT